MRTGRFGREEKHVARYAWPAGVATAGLAWYSADSLRHRRESGHGYNLRGEVDVREASFLRAAESVTGAPVSFGNDAELLINGDEIFPAYLGAIRDAEETVNLLTYAYWRGEIAVEVAETLCEKASSGVECTVIGDAGARFLAERLRDLHGDLAAPVRVGEEVHGLLRVAYRPEIGREDLVAVDQ